MKPASLSEKQNSGTIVVDISALLDLCGNISSGFMANGVDHEHYIKTLIFLSENGYKVLIPEMVALEAAEALADGKDIHHFFDSKDKFQDTNAVLRPFLRDVGNGIYPNIEIVKTGPDKVSTYLGELHKIIDAHNDEVKSIGRYRGRNLSRAAAIAVQKSGADKDAVKRVAEARDKRVHNTAGWCYESIKDWLSNPKNHENAGKIFVCANKGECQQMAEALGHAWMNTEGLFYSLMDNNLNSYLGMNTAVSYQQVIKDALPSNVFSFASPFLMAIRRSPFCREMAALKAELDAREVAAQPDRELDDMGQRRMRDWAARYSKSTGQITK